MTIIIFIIILGILVLAHEFGHFITARKSGMRVYEFGFGFPPRAFGVYKDPVTKKFVWVFGRLKLPKVDQAVNENVDGNLPATLYSINWLPLGGFCRIKGETGERGADSDSFVSQKAWKRIAVLVAGVMMNILLAAVLLSLGFMIGLPADFSDGVDSKAIVVQAPAVMVQGVDKDSPAAEAGIEFGDKILKINEEQIINSNQMVKYVSEHNQKELNVFVERNGEIRELKLKPRVINLGESARLGVALADAGVIRYPWYIALYKGVLAAVFGIINIFIAFFLLLKNLIIGKGLLFDVSGPVGIAVLVGQSAKLGLNYLINMTAMISLSLAAINILPIPALDGGRIIFILIEKIFKKPVPMKYEQLAHTIGFVVLMALVVIITWRDVRGLF